MNAAAVQESRICRVDGQHLEFDEDPVAVEEPLEIQLSREGSGDFAPVAITMRTPGDDCDLALGFLLSEGVITSASAVQNIEPWGPLVGDGRVRNTVRVTLRAGEEPKLLALDRHFFTTSACGVCGKSSLAALSARGIEPVESAARIRAEKIHTLPDALLAAQPAFSHTGGLHAAGLFDAEGRALLVREDVGRHNAVDKIVGALGRAPRLDGIIVGVSGRAGFELVQKTAAAGIPMLAAVGAPSSLAIDLARALEITLLGFVRGQRFNIYSRADRVVLPAP
jgi:FdhD protein